MSVWNKLRKSKLSAAISSLSIAFTGLALSSTGAQATPTYSLAWAGTSASATATSILTMPLSGSSPATAVSGTIGSAIAADATNLYFVRNGDLVKTDFTGANMVTLRAGVGTSIDSIAVAGSNLYLYEPAGGIYKVAVSGGTPVRFDVGASAFHPQTASWTAGNQIGATGTDLFWVESDGLHKQALSGSSDSLFATNAAMTGNPSNLGAWAANSVSVTNGVIAVSGNTGSGMADFAIYDTTASSPAWSFTAQAFNNWPTVGYAMFVSGLAYLDGAIYFNDGNGWTFKVDAAGTDQTTVYKDPNQNWAQGLAVYQSSVSHVVTFDANGGSGSMAAQSSANAQALSSNTLSRSGYVFSGWNSQANGSGTAYADAASYAFTADVTLYAQWAPATLPVAGLDSSAVRISGISAKQVLPSATSISLFGFNFNKVTTVLVGGIDARFTQSSDTIKIALTNLAVDSAPTITLVGSGFKIDLVAGFRVVAAQASGSTTTPTKAEESFAVFFAPGSSTLGSKAIALISSHLNELRSSASQVKVTAWAQDTKSNSGNASLIRARVATVISWLKARGVSAAAVKAPSAGNANPDSRRAEIYFKK